MWPPGCLIGRRYTIFKRDLSAVQNKLHALNEKRRIGLPVAGGLHTGRHTKILRG